MGSVSPSQSTPGSEITASSINTPINQLAAVINGGVGAENLDATFTALLASLAATQVTRDDEMTFDHIASGCVWSGDAYGSTRNASCTSGVVYINGKRLTVASVSARSFTASRDVYCDLKDNGDGTAIWVYYDNTTNAASPSLATTTGDMRGAIIVVGAGNIANVGAVNQGESTRVLPIISSVAMTTTDSLGNLICPRDPNRRILGYRQIITNFTTASTSQVQVTGLSVPVIVPAGRKVRITAHARGMFNDTAGGNNIAGVWDGVVASGTQISEAVVYSPAINAGSPLSITAVIDVPTASSKTYNLGAQRSGGANTTVQSTGATNPTFLMVELV